VDRVTCEEAFRRLDDYLDRELGTEETRLIEEHLATCAACLQEFTVERSVTDGLRRKLRRAAAPVDLLARIRAKLERAAEEDDGGAERDAPWRAPPS
jgi:anti-sigma factor (TIGR02949 family)